jgi:CubicO group peptidase (beta-lactamase class C family)
MSHDFLKLPPYPAVENETAFDRKIMALMEKHRVAGLAVAIIRKGKPVFYGAYGWADIKRRKEVRTQTLFRVASLSKVVTGTALMQMYEQRKVDLDTDIGRYLGFQVWNAFFPNVPLTLKQIMTHTASLQDEYVDYALASRTDNPPLLSEALCPGGAFYSDKLWGPYNPGEGVFEYANIGSIIVAAVIEKISGNRFDDYCREHIFKPLQMNHTDFNLSHIAKIDDISVLYEYEEKSDTFQVGTDDFGGERTETPDYANYKPGSNGAMFGPQGGLRTNVEDLSRFMLMHINDGSYSGKTILQPDTPRLMRTVHIQNKKENSFFKKSGLNMNITGELIQGIELAGHSGDAYGLLSGLYFDPNKGDGLIFLLNSARKRKHRGGFFEAEKEIANRLWKYAL